MIQTWHISESQFSLENTWVKREEWKTHRLKWRGPCTKDCVYSTSHEPQTRKLKVKVKLYAGTCLLWTCTVPVIFRLDSRWNIQSIIQSKSKISNKKKTILCIFTQNFRQQNFLIRQVLLYHRTLKSLFDIHDIGQERVVINLVSNVMYNVNHCLL